MLNCDCSCFIDVGEYPEFYTDKVVTAKKQHKCYECGETISIGDKYQRCSGKWDGEVLTYKTCLGCMRIRDAYCSNGWVFGELREAFMECMGWDYIDDELEVE